MASLSKALIFMGAMAASTAAAARTFVPNVPWEQRAIGEERSAMWMFEGRLWTLQISVDQSTNQLWSSKDTGRSWTLEPNKDIQSMRTLRWKGKDVMFKVSGSDRTLYRTEGSEEIKVANNLPQLPRWRKPVFQVGDVLFVQTIPGLSRSVDGGRTWTLVEPRLAPVDSLQRYQDFPIDAVWGRGANLLIRRDRSLWLSSDTGKTWKSLKGVFTASGWMGEGDLPSEANAYILANPNGAPLRVRISGETWTIDTLAVGWPKDSLGLSQRALSILQWHDTLWACANRNLMFLDESSLKWTHSGILLPTGYSLKLQEVVGQLWIHESSWAGRRLANGKFEKLPPIEPKRGFYKNSLGWQEPNLFACGWEGCWRSTDSGLTWSEANAGLEGTWVASLTNTSRGLVASTGDMGLRRWSNDHWVSDGMEGIPTDTTTGRYPIIFGFGQNQDTTLLNLAWPKGTWIRKGRAVSWVKVDTISTDLSAFAEGKYWQSNSDTVWSSTDGSTWKSQVQERIGLPHEVNGKILFAGNAGNKVAWKDGDTFRIDTVRGYMNNGSIAAHHPAGDVVMSGKGVTLFGKTNTYDLDFTEETSTPWIGALLVVGNRIFMARTSGLWTYAFTGESDVALRPSVRHRIQLQPRGWSVHLDMPQTVELAWYGVDGSLVGRQTQVLERGAHTVSIPQGVRGMVIGRLRVGGLAPDFQNFLLP